MIYTLPQVNINNVNEFVPFIIYNNSLDYYINTIPPTTTYLDLSTITKYTPIHSNFFVMLELLQTHNIEPSELITLGSNSCKEAMEWLTSHKSLQLKATPLIVADIDDFKEEVRFALQHQTVGGSCFLKVTDTNSYSNIQYIYYLCGCYKNVQLCKPKSISNTSLEKYIICSDFKEKINIDENINIPYYFITKINELNSIYSQVYFNQFYYNHDTSDQLIQWSSTFFN
jgi:hypothetical protein